MKLKEYTFRIDAEIVTALDNYERREGNFPSLTFIINDFLENLMIDKGFLKEPEIELGEVITPFEVENPSKNKRFKRTSQGTSIRLYCGNLDFSSHSSDLIDEVENKLDEYSDDELVNLSRGNQPVRQYKRELYLKLGIKTSNSIVRLQFDKRYSTYRVRISDGKTNYYFGSHTKRDAEKVKEFLDLKPKSEAITYSSKVMGKKGKKYNKWLFNKMEKEGFNYDC